MQLVVASSYAQLILPTQLDSNGIYTIKNIIITGNKKTKNYIVIRDIIFAIGDSIPYIKLQPILDRSQRNIYNNTLFNDVKLIAVPTPNKPYDLTIYITVIERWYIYPIPTFELYDRNYKVWAKVYNSDISRVKYGLKFSHNNFTGRRDKLSINIIDGFSKEYSFDYNQPYADKKLEHGFGFGGGYVKRIGVSYNDSLNTALPRQLCASCAKPDFTQYQQKDYYASVNYSYRNGPYRREIIGLNYINSSITDTLAALNRNYFLYGRTKAQFFDLTYYSIYNKVDYFAYPLRGQYYQIRSRLRFSVKDLNFLQLSAYSSKYVKLAKKLYASTQNSATINMNENEESYYNLKTTNTDIPNIHGLEQYSIVANWSIATRNTIKYKLYDGTIKYPFKIFKYNDAPLKIFVRAFADLAYAKLTFPNYSNLHNTLLHGYGLGIDIITRYDYTFGVDFTTNHFGKFSIYFK